MVKKRNPITLFNDGQITLRNNSVMVGSAMYEFVKRYRSHIHIQLLNSSILYISDVEVKTQYRGIGYGRRLITDIIKYSRCNHIDYIQLDVECDNIVAMNLYESHNFIKYKFNIPEKTYTMLLEI